MSWDPSVLRKYNTTGHFRLLNQLRGELKSNPLVRPKDGQTVAEANRSRALQRVTEGRDSRSGSGRSRSGRRGGAQPLEPRNTALGEVASAHADETFNAGPFTVVPVLSLETSENHS
ncbi:MAG: hypothetical protein VKL97_05180 [Cyanobacteriota bacterium]|nr:hypothetical protein [Cyanobacteriota bacterium]